MKLSWQISSFDKLWTYYGNVSEAQKLLFPYMLGQVWMAMNLPHRPWFWAITSPGVLSVCLGSGPQFSGRAAAHSHTVFHFISHCSWTVTLFVLLLNDSSSHKYNTHDYFFFFLPASLFFNVYLTHKSLFTSPYNAPLSFLLLDVNGWIMLATSQNHPWGQQKCRSGQLASDDHSRTLRPPTGSGLRWQVSALQCTWLASLRIFKLKSFVFLILLPTSCGILSPSAALVRDRCGRGQLERLLTTSGPETAKCRRWEQALCCATGIKMIWLQECVWQEAHTTKVKENWKNTYPKGRTQGECKTQLEREWKLINIVTMTAGRGKIVKTSFLTNLQQHIKRQ